MDGPPSQQASHIATGRRGVASLPLTFTSLTSFSVTSDGEWSCTWRRDLRASTPQRAPPAGGAQHHPTRGGGRPRTRRRRSAPPAAPHAPGGSATCPTLQRERTISTGSGHVSLLRQSDIESDRGKSAHGGPPCGYQIMKPSHEPGDIAMLRLAKCCRLVESTIAKALQRKALLLWQTFSIRTQSTV